MVPLLSARRRLVAGLFATEAAHVRGRNECCTRLYGSSTKSQRRQSRSECAAFICRLLLVSSDLLVRLPIFAHLVIVAIRVYMLVWSFRLRMCVDVSAEVVDE